MREMRAHHQLLPVLPGKTLAHKCLRLDPVRVACFTAVTSPPIEAPCSPPAADRESSKCKEVIPFYCSSLANPGAQATGFPLRSNKLRGMRSLEHFQLQTLKQQR